MAACGLKISLNPCILSIYLLMKEPHLITDGEVKTLIDANHRRVVNGHVPDISALFDEKLKINLRQRGH